MGKFTREDAKAMLDAGKIDQETFDEMEKDGAFSNSRRTTTRFIETADGTWVSPRLYFDGLGKAEYSEKMLELKTKVNSLFEEYTTTKTGDTKWNQ